MTSGNHIWDKSEILPRHRPDAAPAAARATTRPASRGRGSHVGKGKDSRTPVATLNLSGRVFMNGSIDDPFAKALRRGRAAAQGGQVSCVDMHGEATSEKMALGYYLDGLVTAVVGTHTHVPTCDHRILPKGTAYCSRHRHDRALRLGDRRREGHDHPALPHRHARRFETAKGDPRLAAVVVDVDPSDGPGAWHRSDAARRRRPRALTRLYSRRAARPRGRRAARSAGLAFDALPISLYVVDRDAARGGLEPAARARADRPPPRPRARPAPARGARPARLSRRRPVLARSSRPASPHEDTPRSRGGRLFHVRRLPVRGCAAASPTCCPGSRT